MIGYASRTGTRRNLDALRSAGWRLLVSATGDHRTEGFAYALDNGAWSAAGAGGLGTKHEWNKRLFVELVEKLGDGADWVVAPDIVQGGLASLELSMAWLPRLLEQCARVLVPVQDGMEARHVEHIVGERVGLFVGGSADWKEATTLSTWGPLAAARGCWLHVGRVNTTRRVSICTAAGATSFDGTSITMFAKNIRKLDGARRQLGMVADAGPGGVYEPARPRFLPQRDSKPVEVDDERQLALIPRDPDDHDQTATNSIQRCPLPSEDA